MTQADPWVTCLPGLLGLLAITVVEGDAFMIADPLGDLRPGTGSGLFHRDTRFLGLFPPVVDGWPARDSGLPRRRRPERSSAGPPAGSRGVAGGRWWACVGC